MDERRDALSLESLGAEVRDRLGGLGWVVRHREVGLVVRSGDGVAAVRGLQSARHGELLERDDGLAGLAFDLGPEEIGVLFLDPADSVRAGDELSPTGGVASVPVGDGLLGRVVDPLGRPLDGGPPIHSTERWPVEREAAGVVERQPVRVPLHTGTKVIDGLLPLGRGQRELILGNRATGKTTIALDAILAQRNSGVLAVYAAIGQRKTSVVEVVDTLRDNGALGRVIIVAADADSPPGQQYLAPYAACTMGEFFTRQGRDVLVIYDDLTKHADAYRRIALLFGRPPGREAYPSDVFYFHARLLERATQLHERLGGGSLTAFPIAETQAGNVSSYIPTNLISITDGQLYLDTRLFNEGVRPAISVGLSVSRIGGKAQPPILRRLAGDLRLLYAQLGELESFARFGAELEPETRRRLERGRRLREALKQPRLDPLSLGHQAAILFAVREGYLDPIPVERVAELLKALHLELDETESGLLATLETGRELSAEARGELHRVLKGLQQLFTPSDDEGRR